MATKWLSSDFSRIINIHKSTGFRLEGKILQSNSNFCKDARNLAQLTSGEELGRSKLTKGRSVLQHKNRDKNTIESLSNAKLLGMALHYGLVTVILKFWNRKIINIRKKSV